MDLQVCLILSANSAGCSGGGGGRGAERDDPVAGRPHTALRRRFCPGAQAHPARSSEFADSILMTSAPWSARTMVASGPEIIEVRSITRYPCKGPGMQCL